MLLTGHDALASADGAAYAHGVAAAFLAAFHRITAAFIGLLLRVLLAIWPLALILLHRVVVVLLAVPRRPRVLAVILVAFVPLFAPEVPEAIVLRRSSRRHVILVEVLSFGFGTEA